MFRGWRLLFEFSRNTVATQPSRAFDELIVRRQILGIESLLLNDPDGVRYVLTTAMDKYKRPVAAGRILAPLGGDGLFLAEGARWRRQRRMLAPPVHAGERRHPPPTLRGSSRGAGSEA